MSAIASQAQPQEASDYWATRWEARRPFDWHTAAIAPAIDFHLGMRHGHDWADGELFDTLWEIFDEPEQARQETAILHVHPLNWPRHQWLVSSSNAAAT